MRNSSSRSVQVGDCFDSDKQNIVHHVAYIYMLTSNEEISKIEKHTFKNTDRFFLSLPVFDKGLVLPDKVIHLSKTRVSNALGSPRGVLIPSPRD